MAAGRAWQANWKDTTALPAYPLPQFTRFLWTKKNERRSQLGLFKLPPPHTTAAAARGGQPLVSLLATTFVRAPPRFHAGSFVDRPVGHHPSCIVPFHARVPLHVPSNMCSAAAAAPSYHALTRRLRTCGAAVRHRAGLHTHPHFTPRFRYRRSTPLLPHRAVDAPPISTTPFFSSFQCPPHTLQAH